MLLKYNTPCHTVSLYIAQRIGHIRICSYITQTLPTFFSVFNDFSTVPGDLAAITSSSHKKHITDRGPPRRAPTLATAFNGSCVLYKSKGGKLPVTRLPLHDDKEGRSQRLPANLYAAPTPDRPPLQLPSVNTLPVCAKTFFRRSFAIPYHISERECSQFHPLHPLRRREWRAFAEQGPFDRGVQIRDWHGVF